MPYNSLPLGAFWTIFGQNFPTGVPQLLYPYQPAIPAVESMFKALNILKCLNILKNSRYIWATDRNPMSGLVKNIIKHVVPRTLT